MKTFSYVARDISGQSQNGYSKALNKNDVMVWLRQQGLMPVELRAMDSNLAAKRMFSRRRVKSIEISSFCWQLHAMIEGGEEVLAEPFRRDALKYPERLMDKYKHLNK